MVSQTKEGKYKCFICKKVYAKDIDASSCEKSHDIVYVPFYRSDLFKLVQYFYTQDRTLLTETLINSILNYSNNMKGVDKSADLE
jgi:hypothetical protein